MYHGEANVADEDLTSFLEVADNLKIRGLHERKTKCIGVVRYCSIIQQIDH